MSKRVSYGALASAILLGGISAACSSDKTTGPDQQQSSPLAGLSATARNDTVTTPSSTNTGTGYFRGTVMGPSPVGATGDTLGNAPRVSGVVVTIYPRLADVNGQLTVGALAGTATTNAQGLFQLPELPAGEYVVRFLPPETSAYKGTYSTGSLRSNSSTYPWWVVLPKK
ncbi:MAG: prealbumin-like fold domain-containing protein [Phycisphaerae bacterium]|nr:prealbumin-like fold domain-containing protein [Gemmatimonadaceae bacterium]